MAQSCAKCKISKIFSTGEIEDIPRTERFTEFFTAGKRKKPDGSEELVPKPDWRTISFDDLLLRLIPLLEANQTYRLYCTSLVSYEVVQWFKDSQNRSAKITLFSCL